VICGPRFCQNAELPVLALPSVQWSPGSIWDLVVCPGNGGRCLRVPGCCYSALDGVLQSLSESPLEFCLYLLQLLDYRCLLRFQERVQGRRACRLAYGLAYEVGVQLVESVSILC
jgi:hypothetical protein